MTHKKLLFKSEKPRTRFVLTLIFGLPVLALLTPVIVLLMYVSVLTEAYKDIEEESDENI